MIKNKILKKVLKTKMGDIAFKMVIGPPILAFGLVGAAMIWFGEKK